jgi:hypothetical protein
MKLTYNILLIFALALAATSCGSRKEGGTAKPEDLISLRSLGLAYLEENKLEEAEQQFVRLINLAPDEALGYANLGLVYLRMSRFPDSEQQLQEALRRAPEDPDIRLILAKIYELTGRKAEAESTMVETLRMVPGHAKTLYSLAELYSNQEEQPALEARGGYLAKLSESAPGNIVPQLYLIENLIRRSMGEESRAVMDQVQQRFPEFQPEAKSFFEQTYRHLQQGQMEDALTSFMIFQNFLKLTSAFQTGVQELAGPGGPLIGFPVITFGQSFLGAVGESASAIDAIVFTDVTASSGLEVVGEAWGGTQGPAPIRSVFTVGDFDGDGDHDIYLSASTGPGGSSHRFLLRQDFGGKFTDIADAAGLRHSGHETASAFADYDNDGHLDLFVSRDEPDLLYQNADVGRFSDKSRTSGLGDPDASDVIRFFDFDHDGDLDLFLGKKAGNQLYRNNGDGTFTEVAGSAALAAPEHAARSAMSGDVDDDGDTDLLVIGQDGRCHLFGNLRGGRFQEITGPAGLGGLRGVAFAALADFDNDGYLDLFTAGSGSKRVEYWRNQGDGSFAAVEKASASLNLPVGFDVRDGLFADFDNDGFQDILLAGATANGEGRGLVLLHNDGKGQFRDVSNLLPAALSDVQAVAVLDYNEDGDMDILCAVGDGTVRLLRNDGGNANNYLKISLVGLRTGSARNNHFGIGSKLEVRSGDLYQMKVVDQPSMHFGLGQRSAVDVVRVLWTNGTAQNIFTPTINQDLVEEQELKGSCPFVYTWDGTQYVFARDFMWRSALGMPLGIMGGDTRYAFPDAAEDYIKIPGEWLAERDGYYPLQLTAELWEAIYFDQVQLLTVDHPDSIEVYVDERFTAPPYPDLHVYKVGRKIIPGHATDSRGADLTGLLAKRDHRYVANFAPGKYQGVAEPHDLILDPGPGADGNKLFLFLSGWIFPTDASINAAMSQSELLQLEPPKVQVPDGKGRWVTAVGNMGFPMGKDKTVVVDLSGKFVSDDRRVRIVTNMQIYWDEAFFAVDVADAPVQLTRITPSSADLHYRGFSRMYRMGGPNGPHWFDYAAVSAGQKWRDLTGLYTRYGEVGELLREADSRSVVANGGDEVTVLFRVGDAPPVPMGWKRDFLLFAAGWVKDGDLNTASGQTLAPLPFRGMTRYPYGDEQAFPASPEHRAYLREYQTREVDSRQFRRLLADD